MDSDEQQKLQQQLEALIGLQTEDRKSQQLRMQVHALSLIDSMFDVYYQTDLDGRLILISPSCVSQTGYRPEEVIGKKVTEFYADPEQRGVLLKILREHGMVNDFTVKLIHKDGQPRYASVTSRYMLNEQQAPIGVEGILRDITGRHLAESEQDRLLRENRHLMARLIQVQEEERRRLAHDLHDELGQLLTSIDASASYIAKYAGDEEARSTAQQILRDTRAAFEGSHGVLMKLRPSTLDALGLHAALTELTDRWNGMPGITCLLEVEGNIDDLSEWKAITVYRLVQEGITNAFRHGKASRISIQVKRLDNGTGQEVIRLLIEDNGKGLQVEEPVSGFGIIGMRERTYALGGMFTLSHEPDHGVRIKVTIPLSTVTGG